MLKNNAIKLMVSAVILSSALSTQAMAAQEEHTEAIAHHVVRNYTELPGKKTDVKLKDEAANKVYARAGTVVFVNDRETNKTWLLLGQTTESVNRIDPAGVKNPLEYSFFSGKVDNKDLAKTIEETLSNTRKRELAEEVGRDAADFLTKNGKVSPTPIVGGDAVKRGGAEDTTSLVVLNNVVIFADPAEVERIFNDSIMHNKGKQEFTSVKLFDIDSINLAAELVDFDRFPLVRGDVKEQWNNFVKHYHHALLASIAAFKAEYAPKAGALAEPVADEAKDKD
jgi:8-oxo-dGTP pyrophosphatase MutT (NUDIX family)